MGTAYFRQEAGAPASEAGFPTRENPDWGSGDFAAALEFAPRAFTVGPAMLSDRSYMRNEASKRPPGFLGCFLGAVAGVFILQSVLAGWFGNDAFFRLMVLSGDNLRAGRFWTLLSHAFLHASALHVLVNLGGAYLLIRYLRERISTGRLLLLGVASALGGAALWLALHFHDYGHLLGISAVLSGYLAVFVLQEPDEPLWLIPLSRRWLLYLFGGADLLGLFAWELPRGLLHHPVAHSAHLGGLAAGLLFHWLVLSPRRKRSAIEPPAWLRKRSARPEPAYTVNLEPPAAPGPASSVSRDALKAEVDRILDKINLHGFGSLTEREKRVLDEARQQLSHR